MHRENDPTRPGETVSEDQLGLANPTATTTTTAAPEPEPADDLEGEES
jgi:hypothetical protein